MHSTLAFLISYGQKKSSPRYPLPAVKYLLTMEHTISLMLLLPMEHLHVPAKSWLEKLLLKSNSNPQLTLQTPTPHTQLKMQSLSSVILLLSTQMRKMLTNSLIT